MPTFAYTITGMERTRRGLALLPGFRFSEQWLRPGLKKIFKGAPVEIRSPSGSRRTVDVLYAGSPARRRGEASTGDPIVLVTVEESVGPLPIGATLWVMDGSTLDHAATSPTPAQMETAVFTRFSALSSHLASPERLSNDQILDLVRDAMVLHQAGRIKDLQRLGRIKNLARQRIGEEHEDVQALKSYLKSLEGAAGE